MFDITLITMGKLKEKFYISAAQEYAKRLGAYCRFTLLELPEVRLPEDPSPAEISAGLDKEAETIFAKIPKGAWFCVFTPEGKAIFVEDMQRKDGELFSSYVKLDEATGRPNYTRYNPDSPEGAREIYIPKEIGGVKLTAEEQKDLREGRAIFLNDMVNNRGEEFSSFIKADLETGRLMYSRTPDGFEERAKFEIPKEIFGAKLSGQQRADLQSGKSVLVEGMKGFDGKSISQYVKLNSNQNKLDFYNENPDRNRNASQRNVVAEKQEKRQSKGQSI